MQLLNPVGLLLLGLIPILLLIHSLKPKAREVPVTTLFLWREVLREQPAGWHWRRLLKNLPLLFQILIILFSTLALIQPVWLWNTEQYGNMILVLDTSASMQTRSGTQTRFDHAREKALQLIEDLPVLSKALIIESGMTPQVKIHFSGDKQKLSAVIEEIQPVDAAGNLKKAVFLALSFFEVERDDQIFVITDGAGGEFHNISEIHDNVKPILIQGGNQNAGILKFEIRKEFVGEDRYQVLLEIRNFNQTLQQIPLLLRVNNTVLANPEVILDPQEKKVLFFPYSGNKPGIAEALLELEDDFPIDNQAFAVLVPPKPVKVLLFTKGNYFLEKLLAAHPNIVLEQSAFASPGSWEHQVEQQDIIIMDRMSPPFTKTGNYLLIDSYSPDLPLFPGNTIENPAISDWDRNHPIMKNLDWAGIHPEVATRVQVIAEDSDETLHSLVESRQTGLLYTYENEDLRVVQFAFDLNRSVLPMKVAFPVLMNNIFRWLYPYKFEFASLQSQAGSPFPLQLRSRTQEVTIQLPSGKIETHFPESSRFHFFNTMETGIYLAQQGRSNQFFAVNLLNEQESDIRVPEFPNADTRTALGLIVNKAIAQYSLWGFLFLMAALFILLEWHFWLKTR